MFACTIRTVRGLGCLTVGGLEAAGSTGAGRMVSGVQVLGTAVGGGGVLVGPLLSRANAAITPRIPTNVSITTICSAGGPVRRLCSLTDRSLRGDRAPHRRSRKSGADHLVEHPERERTVVQDRAVERLDPERRTLPLLGLG